MSSLRIGASQCDQMRFYNRRRRRREEKEKRARRRGEDKRIEGGGDVGVQKKKKSSSMQRENAEGKKKTKREFVGKDLLLGKGTVSFQAINKGTLWEHKEEGQ